MSRKIPFDRDIILWGTSEWCRLLARTLSREIYETETSLFCVVSSWLGRGLSGGKQILDETHCRMFLLISSYSFFFPTVFA